MKMSKEIKIALVSIATIVVFILGANFLKGKNFLKSERIFYAFYDDASGLIASSSVTYRGMKVGRVDKLEFVGERNQKVKATIVINERLIIPKNTIARIATADLFGTKVIELVFSDESEFAKSGDTLDGEVEPDMISGITTQLMPMKDKIESLVTSLDTLTNIMIATLNDDAQRQLQNSIRDLSASLNNVRSLTSTANKTLNDQRENLETIFENFAKISNDLSNVSFESTVNSLQSTLAQTQALIKKLSDGEGTASLLLNDQKLYEELTNSATNLSNLLEDLTSNPKRYVHFSLFGRRAR